MLRSRGCRHQKKRPGVDFFSKASSAGLTNLHNQEYFQIGKYYIIAFGAFPRVLARMPHKPYTTSFVAPAPIRRTVGDVRHVL